MQLKKIKIGNLITESNVFLAPLAGYTNAPFRAMCQSLGAGLAFTEMVSAKGLCYGSENTAALLKIIPENTGIKAVQLFGCEPEFIGRAACSEEVAPFDLIDINMGCPVPKIYKNGKGSALLNNIPLAQKLVAAAKKSGKAVSVKIRVGVDGEHIVTRDFAVAMEEAGADLITVHGRTRDKMYSGEVNYKEIALAKTSVHIPIIANGGIFCTADADKLMDETGADGVMIARGAMFSPFVFADITGTPYKDKKSVILNQLNLTFRYYDERFATVYMRKMLSSYVKGAKNAAALRSEFMKCASKEEILRVLNAVRQ